MPPWIKELIVPMLMLAGVGAYWFDAASLSSIALAFPTALTVVILVSVAIIAFQALRAPNKEVATGHPQTDEATGVAAVLRPWSLVLLPLPLIFFWREIGALPALMILAIGLMLVLGARRRRWFLLLPALLIVPTYLLFKFVLYVRLPEMPFGGV